MEFFRQEYGSALPFLPSGDLPHPGPNAYLLPLLHWQVGSLPAETLVKPINHHICDKKKHTSNIYACECTCMHMYMRVF